MATITWHQLRKSHSFARDEFGDSTQAYLWKGVVGYYHKTNVARWWWMQRMDKATTNDLLGFVRKINLQHGHNCSGWDELIPVDPGNARRVNHYINIPHQYLDELDLLSEATNTYFSDWRVD